MRDRSQSIRYASWIGALTVALGTPLAGAQGRPAPNPKDVVPDTSMPHANEKISMVVPPKICGELGFVPGTERLTANGSKAIEGIAMQWQRSANNSGLAVKLVVAMPLQAGPTADKPAKGRELAAMRKQALGKALLGAGIPESNISVWVAAAAQSQKLSCKQAIR
jgi:hypothetical protein